MNEITVNKETIKLKKEIEAYLKDKALRILNKKKPSGKEYAYTVHNSDTILGIDSGYDSLYLVGDNWLKSNNCDIALMVGFNDWKLGFTADYLPEYRTAFLPRTKMSFLDIRKLKSLKQKPSVIIIWGYTESQHVTHYAKKNNLPIYRMEDAFIRSAKLGAQHATPYSLILDKTGFYYNCYEPSDLENILNTYDFKTDTTLMNNAQECIQLIKDLRLSKYNPPKQNVEGVSQQIKLKKRVAVLGQVDGDASIKFGNPDNWTSEELIQLAAYENPDCEIFYRPHPEVYQGFQTSKVKAHKVKQYATIAAPDENIIDFIEAVDHVYTISSLSGFEAVIRNKKVTTVGAPFYSGWGVTDDRVTISRRRARLSIEEVFAAAYLIYPKYLADITDANKGIRTSFLRIIAEQELELHSLIKKLNKEEQSEEFNEVTTLQDLYIQLSNLESDIDLIKVAKSYNFSTHINQKAPHFNEAYILLLSNRLKYSEAINILLEKTRVFLQIETFNSILNRLGCYLSDSDLAYHYAWLLEKNNEGIDGLLLLNEPLYMNEPTTIDVDPELNEVIPNKKIEYKNTTYFDHKLNLLEDMEQLENYKDMALTSILESPEPIKYLLKLSKVYEKLFHIESAFLVSRLCSQIDILAYNKQGIARANDLLPLVVDSLLLSWQEIIQLISQDSVLKPERALVINSNVEKLSNQIGYFQKAEFLNILSLDNSLEDRKVASFLDFNEPDKAMRVLESLINLKGTTVNRVCLYSKILSAKGDYHKAIELMINQIKKEQSLPSIKELLRLYSHVGYFKEAMSLIDKAISLNIELPATLKMPIYLGLRSIEEAYNGYFDIPFRRKIEKLLPNFCLDIPSQETKNIVVLSVYGPGDEIRFASIYKDIIHYYGINNITFTCERRLYSIFKRSFPKVKFIPVSRIRGFDKANPVNNYNKLPSAELCTVLDNESYSNIPENSNLLFVTDFISKFRKNYSDFPGVSVFQSQDTPIKKSLEIRSKGKIVVGINWRSSLTSFTRQVHYLTIQELSPIFELENILFVNLQYDECQQELDWVEKQYPNKLINLPNIDQYNDFESVISIMTQLDVVIAPCTSVLELAGALGIKSLSISNSAGMAWRIRNDNQRDVWYQSIKHIQGDQYGDKMSLVKNLVNELEQFSK